MYTIVCFSVTHLVFELYCLSCTITKLFLHCDSDTTASNVRIVHSVEIQTHVASELWLCELWRYCCATTLHRFLRKYDQACMFMLSTQCILHYFALGNLVVLTFELLILKPIGTETLSRTNIVASLKSVHCVSKNVPPLQLAILFTYTVRLPQFLV